jgi:polyhydroxyalkanoate synthase
VLAACLVAGSGCATPRVTIHGDISHPVTDDGWPLTVEHFAPPAGVAPRPRPIILCHGVLVNRRFFELEGEQSLPIVLSQAGFDVWLVDLRGRPDAGAPGWWFGDHTYDYDLDDFVRYDADTLITHVLARTHAHDVAWVGHSLGGMIAYGRLGALHESRVGALVTVGSPGLFAPASRNLMKGVEAQGLMVLLPVVPTEPLASLEGHLGIPLAPPMLRDTIFAKENLPPETYNVLEEIAVANATKRELRQFARSVQRGEFVSADGSVSYTAALGSITAPSLVVVGRADELADPLVGREVFERLGSKDKELVIAGRADGFSGDLGHVDLMVGPAARRDVYPRIVAWLAKHDGSR